MAERKDLDAAVAAGILRPEQVAQLGDFLAAQKAGVTPPASGEESLRFIRNFHDVFLAVGIVLFAGGMAVAIGTTVAGSTAPQQGATMVGVLSLGAAAVMWGLGELFARRRRLFLPAIATVIALEVFAIIGVAALYFGTLIGTEPNLGEAFGEAVPPQVRVGILLAASMAIVAPLGFYLRFRLPFSLGLVGGGIAGFIIIAAMLANLDATVALLPALQLVLGAALFVAAVGFDMRDPERATRFSDNGFWLHFAAAPLILGGAFGLVAQAFGAQPTTGSMNLILAANSGSGAVAQSVVTLIIVGTLGFLSVLINRRVLIVSALITTGTAIGIILSEVGLGAGGLAASVLLTLGAFVLILGAGWHALRRVLLGWIKPEGVWARVFPPASAPV